MHTTGASGKLMCQLVVDILEWPAGPCRGAGVGVAPGGDDPRRPRTLAATRAVWCGGLAGLLLRELCLVPVWAGLWSACFFLSRGVRPTVQVGLATRRALRSAANPRNEGHYGKLGAALASLVRGVCLCLWLLRLLAQTSTRTRHIPSPRPPPTAIEIETLDRSTLRALGGDGVVLGGAPGEPRGRREDLQDQVRSVPHRRQGRRPQAR